MGWVPMCVITSWDHELPRSLSTILSRHLIKSPAAGLLGVHHIFATAFFSDYVQLFEERIHRGNPDPARTQCAIERCDYIELAFRTGWKRNSRKSR